MEEKKKKLIMGQYKRTAHGSNGILIYCSHCGSEIEETSNGFYPPIEYEEEKYNRECENCRESL